MMNIRSTQPMCIKSCHMQIKPDADGAYFQAKMCSKHVRDGIIEPIVNLDVYGVA